MTNILVVRAKVHIYDVISELYSLSQKLGPACHIPRRIALFGPNCQGMEVGFYAHLCFFSIFSFFKKKVLCSWGVVQGHKMTNT